MDLKLRGKTAIVTGGSRGLGKGISLNLASEGVNIVMSYNCNKEKAVETKREIETLYSVKALIVNANVAKEDEVKAMFAAAVNEFKTIDILVNNAGICPQCMIKDMDLAMWKNIMSVNVDGVFLTCKEMVNHFINSGVKGSIVNITSQAVFAGSTTGKSHYAATKGAVHSLTISLAKEVAEYGIRINSLAPGMVHTDLTAEIIKTDAERYSRTIPLNRIAEPEEVAKMVTIMVSDASSYMTGASVGVNGGLYMR